MKLWLLRPISDGVGTPWDPWYDRVFGFVVRAETEHDARVLAAKKRGDEGSAAWLWVEYSSCVELTANGLAKVILADQHCA